MTQGRSPSQSQIVQVQVRTGCGGGRWGAQAGEGRFPETLLLLQLLLQTTDLPQVGLYQGPLQGKTDGRFRVYAGPGSPMDPQTQTRAETAGVSHAHTPSGHRWEVFSPSTCNADVPGYCGWQGQGQSSPLSRSHRDIYTNIRL